MTTPTPEQLLLQRVAELSELTLEDAASIADGVRSRLLVDVLGFEEVCWLCDRAKAARERFGGEISMLDIAGGIMAAVKTAEIDLHHCRSRRDVHATVMAYLTAGANTIEGGGR